MKRFLLILAAAAMVFSLAACGGDETPATTGAAQSAQVSMDLAQVFSDMKAKMPEMTDLGENAMLNRYGIKAEYCSEAYVAVCTDGMKADEIWLIKANDETSLQTLQTLANNRMQAKDDESVTYSPEQNKIVKQGKVVTNGLYLALIVSPEVTALEAVFANAAK